MEIIRFTVLLMHHTTLVSVFDCLVRMLLSTKRSEKTSDMRKTLACWQLRRVIFRMHADLLFIMHVGTSFQ